MLLVGPTLPTHRRERAPYAHSSQVRLATWSCLVLPCALWFTIYLTMSKLSSLASAVPNSTPPKQLVAAPPSPKSPTAEDAARWPILAAWKWLVPIRTEVVDFAADAAGCSAAPTRMESCNDLACRGVLPSALGHFIKRTADAASNEAPVDPDSEFFRSSQDLNAASEDVAHSLRNLTSAAGAGVNVLRLLFLGLRSIRAENQGLEVLRELRWLAPALEVAVARLRGACRIPGYRPSDARLRSMLLAAGVPSSQRGKLSWVVDGLPWELARIQLSHFCHCPRIQPEPRISCCSTCRGAQLQTAVAHQMCPWCHQDSAGEPTGCFSPRRRPR